MRIYHEYIVGCCWFNIVFAPFALLESWNANYRRDQTTMAGVRNDAVVKTEKCASEASRDAIRFPVVGKPGARCGP